MPHTIRKNAREWQRLWRGGDIITEVDGDDPGMPRRAQREPAVDRLTTAELFIFDAPRRDRLELDTDASGEPVSWVAQDQIDRIIYR